MSLGQKILSFCVKAQDKELMTLSDNKQFVCLVRLRKSVLVCSAAIMVQTRTPDGAERTLIVASRPYTATSNTGTKSPSSALWASSLVHFPMMRLVSSALVKWQTTA
jgi:hypothetical protein